MAIGDGNDVYELWNEGAPVDAFGERRVVSPPTLPWASVDKVAKRKRVPGGTPAFSLDEWSFDATARAKPGTHAVSSLIISEIGFHADYPLAKWVEVYNPTNATVSLTGYKIIRYADEQEGETNVAPLGNGTVLPKQARVIVKSQNDGQFNTAYGAPPPNQPDLAGPINGSGHDAYALVKDDERVDLYGKIGPDLPSEPWEFGTGSVRRKYTVTRASSTFDVTEWIVSGTSPGEPRAHFQDSLYISEVADHPDAAFDAVQWIELCNPTSSDIVLDGHYTLYRYRQAETAPFPSGGQPLIGTIKPGRTFVIVQSSGRDEFKTEYGFDAQLPSSIIDGFNDNFELRKDGIPIDVYGQIGTASDPNPNDPSDDKPWAYRYASAERAPATLAGATASRQSSRWRLRWALARRLRCR